jgi:hypothetical protein
MPDEIEPCEALPVDIVTLCQILARIFYRCVQEQEAQTLRQLFGSPCSPLEEQRLVSDPLSAREI